jgi:pimeloyl-ACP methyl ester carboxylesterase
MDEDLSAVTEGKAPNPFLKDLSSALRAEGFAVLRYHKRSYQARLRLAQDPEFSNSAEFAALAADPLGSFFDDAVLALDHCARVLPDARRYLVGHSQGANLAVQVARTRRDLAGVGLIGFTLMGTPTLVFEQTAYRPLGLLEALDADHDGALDAQELGADDHTARGLAAQMGVLDLDGDGRLSRAEFMGGNLSNWVLKPELLAGFDPLRVREASWPSMPAALVEVAAPVAFFVGERDNQTPAYNVKAAEMAAPHRRPRPRWTFHYFPGLGHALDPREGYGDLVYRRAAPEALATVAKAMRALGE